MGDLQINQDFKSQKPTAYYRDLDIANARATTRFTIDGVSFKREIFTSGPDNILMIRISSPNLGS